MINGWREGREQGSRDEPGCVVGGEPAGGDVLGRGVHDRILRRVQSLIERGQRTGTFRRDLPQRWLISTAYSLMHAAAEDVATGQLAADDAAGLITATLLAAFTPPVDHVRGTGAKDIGRARPSAGY